MIDKNQPSLLPKPFVDGLFDHIRAEPLFVDFWDEKT